MSRARLGSRTTARKFWQGDRISIMHDRPTMSADPRPPPRRQSSGGSGDNKETKERHHHTTTNHKKMAAQSQGIKQLMAAEKEAAQVVANARKRKVAIPESACYLECTLVSGAGDCSISSLKEKAIASRVQRTKGVVKCIASV